MEWPIGGCVAGHWCFVFTRPTLRKLQERGLVRSSDQVVVISTAHGLKFVDSKLAYHSMELEGIVSASPNPPIELDADYQAVRDQMLREIDGRFGG